MFGLTRFEWLFLALAVLLCPGIAFGRAEFGLVDRLPPTAQQPSPQPSAAAGGSAPKKE